MRTYGLLRRLRKWQLINTKIQRTVTECALRGLNVDEAVILGKEANEVKIQANIGV